MVVMTTSCTELTGGTAGPGTNPSRTPTSPAATPAHNEVPAQCSDDVHTIRDHFTDVPGLVSVEVEPCAAGESYTVTIDAGTEPTSETVEGMLQSHKEAWEETGLEGEIGRPSLMVTYSNFEWRFGHGIVEPEAELVEILTAAGDTTLDGIVNVNMEGVDHIRDVPRERMRVFVHVDDVAFAEEAGRPAHLERAWDVASGLANFTGFETVGVGYEKRLGTSYDVPAPVDDAPLPGQFVQFINGWDAFSVAVEEVAGKNAVQMSEGEGRHVSMTVWDTSYKMTPELEQELERLADMAREMGYEVETAVIKMIIE